MPNINNATITSIRLAEQGSAPATPAAGFGQLYVKSDGLLYWKDDAGVEHSAESATTLAGDTLWDAKGDLVAGTGANAAAKVTVGTNDQVLIADSAQSAGVKWGAVPTHAHALGDLTNITQSAQILKAPVRVATTANGTLATAYENGDTVDGVVLVTNDRILLKNQTAGAENGIYTVNASGAPTRAADANAAAEFPQGFLVYVTAGTANANTVWKHTTSAAITLDTTALTFAQLGAAAGGSLTIQEVDGNPTNTFTTLKVSNGTLTDNGDGSATVTTGGGGSGNVTSTGAGGSEPGSPASGDLYLPNNVPHLERYSGAAWVPWGPIFPLTAVPSAGWSWVNQGSATIASSGGTQYLESPADASDSIKARVRTAPAAPYTLDFLLIPNIITAANVQFGALWRQSSDGKIVTAGWQMNTNWIRMIYKYTNATTGSAAYDTTGFNEPTFPLFIRLQDDNTNRTVFYSPDGQHWQTIHSVGRTDFLTADQYGFYVNPRNAGNAAGLLLLSLKEA